MWKGDFGFFVYFNCKIGGLVSDLMRGFKKKLIWDLIKIGVNIVGLSGEALK